MVEEMPERDEAYVCMRSGYVYPNKDAIVSSWDSQLSLGHIHCPKCDKISTHTP